MLTTEQELKPFIKWAGGKIRVLSQILPYFPDEISDYYEPFLGGGAVYFALCSRISGISYLSDLNNDLITTYKAVIRKPNELINALSIHQQNHCQSYYFQQRAAVYPSNSLRAAARLIYLNKTCYNGLYRLNSKGKFNVPMGDYKNPKICDSAVILACSEALQNAVVFSQIYTHIIANGLLKPNSFVYFDPPYHQKFTAYTADDFSDNDQISLSHVFAYLTRSRVRAALSNSDTPLIRDLYSGYRIVEISAARSVRPEKAGKDTELLILNY